MCTIFSGIAETYNPTMKEPRKNILNPILSRSRRIYFIAGVIVAFIAFIFGEKGLNGTISFSADGRDRDTTKPRNDRWKPSARDEDVGQVPRNATRSEYDSIKAARLCTFAVILSKLAAKVIG